MLKLQKVKKIAQGHTVNKWSYEGCNIGNLTLNLYPTGKHSVLLLVVTELWPAWMTLMTFCGNSLVPK